MSKNDAIKKRLQELKARSEKKTTTDQTQTTDILFHPEPGKTTIRIVPTKDSIDYPFQHLFFHYHFAGQRAVLSPKSYGEIDPIEEFSDAMIKQGDGNGGRLPLEEWKHWKDFSPREGTFVSIVVRGKESEGVKYWRVTPKLEQQLLSLLEDEDKDYANRIDDVKAGRDIKILHTAKDPKDSNSYANTVIEKVLVDATPLSTDDKIVDALLNKQPDLFTRWKKWTTEELENLLDKKVKTDAERAQAQVNSESSSELEPVTVAAAKTVSPSVPPEIAAEFKAVFDSQN